MLKSNSSKSMKCPESLTKYPIPKILIQEEARNLKDDLKARLQRGEQLCLDLDSIVDMDLAGFNALVVSCTQADKGNGALFLVYKDNPEVYQYFDYSGLTFLLNTLHGTQSD